MSYKGNYPERASNLNAKSAHVKIFGEEKLRAKLMAYTTGVDPATTKNLKAVSRLIRDYAKTIVPVDTGALQQSIRLDNIVVKGKTKRIAVRAGGFATNWKTGRKVDYASFVEFGTSRNRPQPFMRPAYVKYRTALINAISNDVFDRMRRA